MRIMTGLLAVALFAAATLSATAASFSGGPAPADEYFGPHHMSILEIRNRLQHFDSLTDAEMLQPGVTNDLDDVAYSISDWRHQYPNDPWLPHAYAQLLYAYHRAGTLSTAHAQVALSEMRSSYPDSPETDATIAMIYGGDPPELSLFAATAPMLASGVPVVTAPAPIAVPAPVRNGAWARFDAMRGADSGGP
jgi:hypothetical protein